MATGPVNDFENALNARIAKLREEYDQLLDSTTAALQDRFNLILENEQIRTSYMLREAHRERQEKIRALESQLHCKNLAALMYVMCAERTRSKMEKLQLREEYTRYINGLHEILCQGQSLILNLSRGYKTAARVDHEWREKMNKVVKEFMNFIYHFAGGPPETNQYFMDLPNLMATEASIMDDPDEDPCDVQALEEESAANEEPKEEVFSSKDKQWWELLDKDNRPFIVYGDMEEFKPPQRREVLKHVNAKKTAPKIWKDYKFNGMSLLQSCENSNYIKDTMTYSRFKRSVSVETSDQEIHSIKRNGVSGVAVESGVFNGKRKRKNHVELSGIISYGANNSDAVILNRQSATLTASTRRQATSMSVDIRGGDMGSILKIITLTSARKLPEDKSALLAARDSLEVISATKLKSGRSLDMTNNTLVQDDSIKLNVGKKRLSHFNELIEKHSSKLSETESGENILCVEGRELDPNDEEFIHDGSALGYAHNDSLEVIPTHVPEKDHKINYERICPVERCGRMHVNSFMKTLPVYMRANPFTHFQQNFEAYEPCTAEQLEILKERLAQKQNQEPVEIVEPIDTATQEWETGIATQTSSQSLGGYQEEPCTCPAPNATPVDSKFMFSLKDLMPVKVVMDKIQKECFFDDKIEFNRFQVIGQDEASNDSDSLDKVKPEKEDFKTARAQEIRDILKEHHSLLEIFQANARC